MGEVFIICFSITDRLSFERVIKTHEIILQIKKTQRVPIVLVGNKTDLLEERVVSEEEAIYLAKSFGQCPYVETSAKLKQSVDKPFLLALEQHSREHNSNNNSSSHHHHLGVSNTPTKYKSK
eukprot:TRINITY_DN1616_c0_g1_i2.p1 TRINITY_DN1616_c0_g1~~TRINITY_DN1616_c0_g1_i2.p1  ORF type:complete len:122 (+),score=19.95 TRINITY_DN1616_c0_g1_i2:487-852(+)